MHRRELLKGLGGVTALSALGSLGYAKASQLLTSSIPASGELIPKVGMGSWITFDVTADEAVRVRQQVLKSFLDLGGQMVDSSPMYGSSEQVIGRCLAALSHPPVFSAGKIWIPGAERGVHQFNFSRDLWGINQFDLMQVHNMVDWRSHMPTLQQWKAEGEIRYLGLTTSHGRRHGEMLEVMGDQAIDFIQLTYNIHDREVEDRLLPAAMDQGLAVIANRPFKTGALFSMVRGKPLPGLAIDIGCDNWAQFFLKFVISHPALTCAIPATSQVAHMRENMAACYGDLPDAAMRRQMVTAFESVL